MRYQSLLLLILVVLSSCTTALTGLIPQPPLYDNECNASSSEYFDLAMDTRFLAKPGSIPSDPLQARNAAIQWIEAFELENGLKIEIVQKPETGIVQFDKYTTTLPERIYVKDGFFEMSLARQAEILWHEIVHVRQWTAFGKAKMTALWLNPHGRMALESTAYRESVRMRILFGATLDQIKKYVVRRAKSLYEGYALQTIPWDCYRPQVVQVLTADIADG